MNKYILADKLIAEIEIKKEYALEHYHNQGDIQSAYNICCEILSSIESLQQEQPEVDLDKEIEKFFDDCIPTYEVSLYGIKESVIEVGDYELIARHFYELGRLSNK